MYINQTLSLAFGLYINEFMFYFFCVNQHYTTNVLL